MTLGEAARLLRIRADELKGLAERNEVPGRRIGSRWRFNRDALLAWLNGDWRLIATAVRRPGRGGKAPVTGETPSSARGSPLDREKMARLRATGTSIAQGDESSETTEERPDGDTGERIGEAPKERTADEVFLRGEKVLLAPGEVTLEFGQFYSESDNQQLAQVGTGIGLATVERETFTTLLLGRLGVLRGTELFASTSFRNERSDVVLGSTQLSESERSEFGDVRLGVRRTLLHEGVGYPSIIATVDGRIPTGDTSYAVGGGLAFVKSIDPVVLFANANYRHTFSREFSDVTRLEPEDRLDVTLGYAQALNDTLTISTSVSGLFTGATEFDNARLRRQDNFSLQFALTSWLAEGLYIEPSVSFGLNGPGDSFAFGVTVPYTFTP